ncbi:MAG: oxidative damage protection protein [Methylococcaceae bacterium]|nr:oxidative damage protection protein [Methylococcaceae bacterium]MCI0732259.1 oxidative damage protection protein [Methylococcaceae bacterium]
MTRMVQCVKLGEIAEGLDAPPFPGEKGRRIFEHVSKKAWKQWVGLQTMLINEHHLTPYEPKARRFLEAEREKFFFGEGAAAPEGFTPPGPHPDQV